MIHRCISSRMSFRPSWASSLQTALSLNTGRLGTKPVAHELVGRLQIQTTRCCNPCCWLQPRLTLFYFWSWSTVRGIKYAHFQAGTSLEVMMWPHLSITFDLHSFLGHVLKIHSYPEIWGSREKQANIWTSVQSIYYLIHHPLFMILFLHIL